MSKSKKEKEQNQNTTPETDVVILDETSLEADVLQVMQEAEKMQQEQTAKVDFLYMNKPFTFESFAEKFHVKPELLVTTVDILKQQGKIKNLDMVARDKQMDKVLKQAQAIEAGKAIIEDQLKEEQFRLESRREGELKHTKVEFDFGTRSKLNDFRMAVYDLGLNSEIVEKDDGFYVLRVFDITDKEINKLSTLYKANRFVEASVRKAEDVTEKAVKVVDYGVKNIASPVAKAGFSSGAKIAKTLATGLFRMGAMATTEIIHGARSAAYEVKNDPNITLAKAEVIQAKNDILSRAKGTAAGGDGIRID